MCPISTVSEQILGEPSSRKCMPLVSIPEPWVVPSVVLALLGLAFAAPHAVNKCAPAPERIEWVRPVLHRLVRGQS